MRRCQVEIRTGALWSSGMLVVQLIAAYQFAYQFRSRMRCLLEASSPSRSDAYTRWGGVIARTRGSDAWDACVALTTRSRDGLTRQRPDAVTTVAVCRLRRATVPFTVRPSSVSNSTSRPTEKRASWVRLFAERMPFVCVSNAVSPGRSPTNAANVPRPSRRVHWPSGYLSCWFFSGSARAESARRLTKRRVPGRQLR